MTKHHIFFTIQLLFFIFSLNLSGQETIETLYKNRKYNIVIYSLNKKNEKKQLTFDEYFMLSRSYGRTRQYSNGLIYAKKMQDLALKENDTANIIRAVNLASESFVDLGETKEGLKYSSFMSPFFRKKDSIEYQKFCFKLGMMYYYNQNYQEAYDTYNKITKPEYRKLELYTNNYALTLLGLKKWDEAIFYLKKTLNTPYNSSKYIAFSNISQAYIAKKDWGNAKIYLDSANYYIDNESRLVSKKKLYNHYFEFYNQQGKTNDASQILNDIEQINQKLFKKNLNEKLQALETSYKRENTLQMKVKTIDNKLINSEKQKLLGLIIFLFITIGLLTILYLYKYKNIKAAHENILIEQRLLRLQMDPHFIFNSLAVLQGMILNREGMKAVKYVSKFSKLLRLILESSREKLVPINEELKTLNNYIDLQNTTRENPIKYKLFLDRNLQNEKVLIPPMLIQPFIENAIEHGFKNDISDPEINISITFKDKKLQCDIIDNGIGVDSMIKKEFKNKKSLSTKITSERLSIISKQYKIKSKVVIKDRSIDKQKGTLVQLTLPYIIDSKL